MAKKRKSATQIEYEKQVKRIKNIIRREQKKGLTVEFTLPELPKRYTKKRVEELREIKPRTVRGQSYLVTQYGEIIKGNDVRLKEALRELAEFIAGGGQMPPIETVLTEPINEKPPLETVLTEPVEPQQPEEPTPPSGGDGGTGGQTPPPPPQPDPNDAAQQIIDNVIDAVQVLPGKLPQKIKKFIDWCVQEYGLQETAAALMNMPDFVEYIYGFDNLYKGVDEVLDLLLDSIYDLDKDKKGGKAKQDLQDEIDFLLDDGSWDYYIAMGRTEL